MHAAEGYLYAEALLRACDALSLRALVVPGRDLFEVASSALALDGTTLSGRLVEVGRGGPRPWGRDEKNATLVAWLALSGGSGAETG
jgi:hypothetical protein